MNMKKTIAAVAACAVAVSAMATSVSAIDVLEHGTSDLAFETQTVHYNLVKEVKTVAPTVVLKATFERVPLTADNDLAFTIDGIAGLSYTGAAFAGDAGNNLIKGVKSLKITGTYVDAQGANVGSVTPIEYTTDEGSEKYNANLAKADGTIVIPVDSTGIVPGGTGTEARLTVEYEVELNPDFKIVDPAKMTDGTEVVGGVLQAAAANNANKIADENAAVLNLKDDGLKLVNKLLAINFPAAAELATRLDNVNGVGIGETGVEILLEDITDQADIDGTTVALKYDKGEKIDYYPFRTGLNDYFNDVTNDIVAYLRTPKTDNGGMGYVNALAVINDLIANYDEVTFKFNTAVKAVDDSTKGNTGKYDDDNGNKIYKSFAQHLYNLYGQEYDKDLQNTGYINYNWTGYNLFAGALIINDELSMSLNDATIFDYGETSLSFNWADLNNGAAYNPTVNYVRTIKLATSREWYWDSLDITGAITETGDASTNEGTEAEEETIGEDEEAGEDEELGEDEETEEEPAEEEPAAPAENPATGNAPIALAVIPVALAAAAVVAKKRG